MANGKQIVECVPNFSEGRNRDTIAKIIEPFQKHPNVKLLDYQTDADHNRMVVTVIGAPEPVAETMFEAMENAVERIDMRQHQGQHPRMGAIDVVPFIPIRNMSMEDAVTLSRKVGELAGEKLGLPIFLYEASATKPERKNLSNIRKGQFEGMTQKLTQADWKPDFGPGEMHPTAGVTAIGARMPLVAFNVNLSTSDLSIADDIARKVRHISGGLRFCKGIGVELGDRGIVQVSMNLTDFTKTAIYRALEMVRMEARRWGVQVVGSEVVGLVPMAALIDSAVYYMGIEDFSMDQVLETRLME